FYPVSYLLSFHLFSFFFILLLPPCSTLFPYTTLFRSVYYIGGVISSTSAILAATTHWSFSTASFPIYLFILDTSLMLIVLLRKADRKSTRLNSSHVSISYAVFCLKKKKIC